MDSVIAVLVQSIQRLLGAYFRIFFDVASLVIGNGKFEIGIDLPDTKKTYDERIAKIEIARDALVESLSAIDQMKIDAEKAKKDYEKNSENLNRIIESSQDAEEKLADIRAAMQSDISAFQSLAGVPNIKRERWIAFLAGILASTVSAVLVGIATWAWGKGF